MPSTRLTNLRISELSGVDDPANQAPDWIVAKAREFRQDVSNIEKAVTGLYELLDSDEVELYMADAPDFVEKAREALRDHLASGLEDAEDNDEQEGLMKRLSKIFKSGEPNQPVLGAPGATREQVDRVTPAEAHEGDDGPDVTEDQGQDELEGGSQRVVGTGVPEYDDDATVDGTTQEPLGAPAATREAVSRITPAEGPKDPVRTEDQGADELGAEGPQGTSHTSGQGTSHTDANDGTSHSGEGAEDIAKAVGSVLQAELTPLREAIAAIADRQEALEKASAGPYALDGQDGSYGGTEDPGLHGAIMKAVHGGKVVLR